MSYKISSLPNRLRLGMHLGIRHHFKPLVRFHFPVSPSFFYLLFVPPTGGLSLYWHRGMVAEMLIVPSLSIVPVPFRTMALPLTLLFIRYLMVRTAFSG